MYICLPCNQIRAICNLVVNTCIGFHDTYTCKRRVTSLWDLTTPIISFSYASNLGFTGIASFFPKVSTTLVSYHHCVALGSRVV
jgi:hypothetical protein